MDFSTTDIEQPFYLIENLEIDLFVLKIVLLQKQSDEHALRKYQKNEDGP